MSAFFMGKNKRKKEAPPKKLPLKSMSDLNGQSESHGHWTPEY